jgi:hypothetical protein
VKALKAYRTEFDPKSGTNRQRPAHDWTSHAADAFRYLAVGLQTVDRRAGDEHRRPPRVLLKAPKGGQQYAGGHDAWDMWISSGVEPQPGQGMHRKPKVLHAAPRGGNPQMGDCKMKSTIVRMIETEVPVETIPIGRKGHFIVPGVVANDGRQLWALHLPDGMSVGNFWGRDRAEAAAQELIESGSISR